MAKGILGRKLGMTQIFDAAGNVIPVTIIDCSANVVLQQKTVENDGYEAVQVGFADLRKSRSNKPNTGHAAKANTAPKRFIREFRFSEANGGNDMLSYSVGDEIKCDTFAQGDLVDVTGTSRGKGFQGTIKRYNHHRGPMGHGSKAHRLIGSMGPVAGNMKGKKMPGHMGSERKTLQNLLVAAVDTERELILVRGNVPGAKQGYVVIKTAVKAGK